MDLLSVYRGKMGKEVYNNLAWSKAFEYCMANEYAFQRGCASWIDEEYQGQRWNFQLYIPEKKVKVYRQLNLVSGLIERSTPCMNSNFKAIPKGYQWEIEDRGTKQILSLSTYCNFIIGAFTYNYYGDSIISAVKNGKLDEDNADEMHDKLVSGGYDTLGFRYVQLDWLTAFDYASRGGLVVASARIPRSPGHVAIVTGNQLGEENKVNELEIFQAGLTFGLMSLEKGFGKQNISNVVFSAWQKR